MLKQSLLLLFFASSIVSLSAQAAFAHKTSVFAHAHGNAIHGQVIAGVDTPMSGAKITAYGPSDEVLAETVADDKGEFTLKVTQRCDWKIVATGSGHQASYTVPMAELPSDLPVVEGTTHDHAHEPEDAHSHEHSNEAGHSHADDAGGAAGGDEDLHRQIVALREDIHELQNKLRWQDIIGGVGYILGLMGIAFYFFGSRRGDRFPSKTSD